MINEYVKAAAESRARELEAAINRYRDCGVEIERFSIEEWPDESVLCIDGIPRFTWKLTACVMEQATGCVKWQGEYHGESQRLSRRV